MCIRDSCNTNLPFNFDSMADFASKHIKLNCPSNLLGNFDSSFVSNEGQLSRKSARQFRQQILPASSSSSTLTQICSSISTADFASKLTNLKFPSNLLINIDSRFASKRLCVKSSSTFPKTCLSISTAVLPLSSSS